MIRTTTTKTAIVSFAEIGISPDIHYYTDWLGYDEGWYNAERQLTKEEATLIRDKITAYGVQLLGEQTIWVLGKYIGDIREVEYRNSEWRDTDV